MSSSPTRDLIVGCEGEGHRVRLQGGLRFLKAATCPKCRAPVDPLRRKRIVRFVANLGRPASEHLADRAVWFATLAALASTLLGVTIFRTGADVWWPATVLLFAPRWIALLPLAPIVAGALIRDRALLVPLAASLALLVGPFVGFSLGLRGLTVMEREGDLTVATLNAAGGANMRYGPRVVLDRLGADVLLVQECGGPFRDLLLGAEEGHVASARSLCILSRLPIEAVESMDGENLRSVGGSALVTTFSLDMNGQTIHLTNIHLETPRAGLQLILRGRIAEGAEVLRQKSLLREIELRRAERWARERGGPGLVLGDFNTPPESRHIQSLWHDWTDAFGRVGRGIGGTRLNGWIRARIDYVMADARWTVVSAHPGEPVGSDHLPLVARLRLRSTSGP
jgi:endonuclease/exonuclease/phosphatase (EEP) superfamily protein YafD